MPKNISYARPKLASTISTPINTTFKASEGPDALADTPDFTTGTDGVCTVQVNMDANESGGADVQEAFRVEITPAIDAVTGAMTCGVVVRQKTGAAVSSVILNEAPQHSESADAWQSAAGRARQ